MTFFKLGNRQAGIDSFNTTHSGQHGGL